MVERITYTFAGVTFSLNMILLQSITIWNIMKGQSKQGLYVLQGLEVIKLEFVLRLKIKCNDWPGAVPESRDRFPVATYNYLLFSLKGSRNFATRMAYFT